MYLIYLLSYLTKGFIRKVAGQFTDWACKAHSTCGKNSYFKMSASIGNFPKDRSKIIIGEGSVIEAKLIVFNYGGKITVGDNVYIGINTNVWSGDDVKIGNNVLISHGVNIIDTNSHEMDHLERADRFKTLIKQGHPKDKSTIVTKPIVIEDYVWISFGATVLKGVTIGRGAVVAANTMVTKDVPPFVVVAGNPAKIVKQLDPNSNYKP